MKENNGVIEFGDQTITEAESQKRKTFDCGELKIEMKPGKKVDDPWQVWWKLGEKRGVIDPQLIWVMAWMISNDQMKDKLIPVKIEEQRVFYKTIKLQLHKDMKAGSTVITNVKFKVPMAMLVQASENGIIAPK